MTNIEYVQAHLSLNEDGTIDSLMGIKENLEWIRYIDHVRFNFREAVIIPEMARREREGEEKVTQEDWAVWQKQLTSLRDAAHLNIINFHRMGAELFPENMHVHCEFTPVNNFISERIIRLTYVSPFTAFTTHT